MPREPEPYTSKPTAKELDRLFAAVERTVAADRGVLGWLRRRPLSVRVTVGAGVALGIAGITWALMPRADWVSAPVPAAHLGSIALAAVLVVLGAVLAAWPLHRRAPSTSQIVGVGLASAGLALGMAWALGVQHGTEGGELFPALRCAMLGLVLGAPAAMVTFALRRGATGAAVGATAVGSAVALVAQTTTCAVETLPHMLAGHAAPLLAAGGVAIVWTLRPTRDRARPST